MKASFRELFRKLISILCCCTFVTALTGIILGISNSLFPLPIKVSQGLITIHQGAFLGYKLTNFYILSLGLGVLVLGFITVIEEKYNFLFVSFNPLLASISRTIALILVIPLAVCVQTGLGYRLYQNWFGVGTVQTVSLLQWHSGSGLGSWWDLLYTMTAGISLLLLSVLNFNHTGSRNHHKKSLQDLFKRQLKKFDLAKNISFPLIAKEKYTLQKLALLLGSIILCGFLYYFISKILIVTFMFIILLTALILLIFKELFGSQQELKALNNKLEEEEAKSITMLKAIPDSILRMSRDGICLSYMPAIDTQYFVLEGNIINRHITEFVESKVAISLIKTAELSLETGSTQIFRFSIPIDNEDKHHEARVTAIGSTEVLILVREIVSYNQLSNITNQDGLEKDTEFIQLLTEPDLVHTLEKTLEQIEHNPQVQMILVCLALKTSNDAIQIELGLLQQIVIKVSEVLPENDIFQVQDHNLIMLVGDRTMEEIFTTVNNLNNDMNKMFPIWQKDFVDKVESSVCLLEVDQNSSDAQSLINTIQITCQIAKQKVKLKTF